MQHVVDFSQAMGLKHSLSYLFAMTMYLAIMILGRDWFGPDDQVYPQSFKYCIVDVRLFAASVLLCQLVGPSSPVHDSLPLVVRSPAADPVISGCLGVSLAWMSFKPILAIVHASVVS